MSIFVQNLPLIKQGADYVAYLPLSSGTLSTSDCTFSCHIRRFAGGPLLASLETRWDGSVLTLFASNAVTSKIPANTNLGTSKGGSLWVYDLFANFSDGTRLCLSEGNVPVDPNITPA